MKTALFVVLLGCVTGFGADVLTERLQRGLFEEEANHNLEAAIKEYQSVVAQSDEQRKIIATALFRLGECYRKLGKTNEANAQYQRVIRDFAEQEQLVKLSQNLLPIQRGNASPVRPASNPAAVKLLREEISLAERQVSAVENRFNTGKAGLFELLDAKKEVLRLKRQLPENAPAGQQRAVIEEQIGIVRQLLAEFEKRIQVGVVAPGEQIPIQRELLSLQRELAENAAASQNVATGESGDSELARELERRKARLQGELSEVRARLDVLNKMSRDQLLGSASQFFNDSTLTELQQQLRAAEQRLVTLRGTGIGAQHPDVAGAQTLSKHLQAQISERLDSLLRGQRTQLDVLNAQFDGVSDELQKAKRGVTELSAENPVGVKDVAREEEKLINQWRTQLQENPDLVNKADLGPPLYNAVKQAQFRLAEFLITNGANINARGPEASQAALHLAARLNRKEFVELLLKHGADLKARDSQNNTPLSTAVAGGLLVVAQWLIDAGAELNVLNYQKQSPLMIAVGWSYRAMTELLLKRGADPNFGPKSGNDTLSSPMSLAMANGNDELVKLLIAHKADANLRGNGGETPLLQAVRGKRVEIVKALLAAKADPARSDQSGNTPLMAAAGNGSVDITKLLLDGGANPDAMSGTGAALHYAARNGHDENVRLLLERGANINARTNQGATALYSAVQGNRLSTVGLLLERGANPNIVSDGWTPLDYAKAQAGGTSQSPDVRAAWEEIVGVLLTHGANAYVSRQQWIGFGRSTNDTAVQFRRTTNDWNRYTLFELIAGTFNSYPFPDLDHARISRVESGKLRDISLDLTKFFQTGGCSNDMWLEWGDVLIIPELDHKLGEAPTYFPTNAGSLLERCLARTVTVIVKGSTNQIRLVQPTLTSADPRLQANAGGVFVLNNFVVSDVNFGIPADQSSDEPPPKTISTFRLKEVVMGSRMLRASSDQTRIRVARPASARGFPWSVDLTKIATQSEWPDTPGNPPPPNARGKLSWRYDLWLRDGDVIEVPEKQ